MPVPYGFGVGDFVAVGTLAWNVYKSCKAAPGSFSNISNEVLSLHAVLKEADETISRSPLSPKSQARLNTISDGCQSVLSDLQALVDKYENMGTQSKWTWDRIKWGAEDIVGIRSRLISNTTFLTAYISTSQTRVEQKLDKLISDIQQGKRAPSVVSLQTVDSLNPDDKEAWRTIRKELEDIGISIAAFDANKHFIFEWFSNAVDTGAFQEKAGSSPPGSVHSLDVQSSTSSLSRWVEESNQAEQASNGIGATGGPHAPAIPTKVPRFAAFLASLSQPKKRLNDALLASNFYRVRKILTDSVTSRLIDKPTLNNALDSAIRENSIEACALLIDAGADVNYQIGNGESLLTMCVRYGKKDLAAFLLDRGADVNYQSGHRDLQSSALRASITNYDEAMITFLSQRGADLNAVQECNEYEYSGHPTAIHQATAESRLAIVNLLINLGADFNSPQRHCGTPLMLSIYRGCVSSAELLIKRGADINEVNVPLKHHNRLFYSAIHVAILVSSPYLVALLLYNGVGTDLHEAYEFAAQHTVLIFRGLSPPGSMSYYNTTYTESPVKEFFVWETRKFSELSNDAYQVQALLKERKEKSAVRV